MCLAAPPTASQQPPRGSARRVGFQPQEAAFLERHLRGAQQSLRQAVASASQAGYRTGPKRWYDFVDKAVPNPRTSDYIPTGLSAAALTQRLMAFVHYLHTDLGLTPGAVRSTLTGLRHEFRANFIDPACFDDPVLKAARRGLARISSNPTRRRGPRAPFTVEMVKSFGEYARSHPSWTARMTSIGALLGFFVFFRGSEYCYSSRSAHMLSAGAVEFEVFDRATRTTRVVPAHQVTSIPFSDVRAVRVTSHSAKNLLPGESEATWFSKLAPGEPGICLAQELYQWACEAQHTSARDPFLSYPSAFGQRTLLTYETMLRAVKAVGARFGLPPQLCGTHSLRIGGATALHTAGGTDLAVMQAGRWRTPPVALRYPQRTSRGNDEQLRLLQTEQLTSVRDIRMARGLPSNPGNNLPRSRPRSAGVPP